MLKSAGSCWIIRRRGRYDLHEMAIAAALAGQGVALVPHVYVENAIENGLLAAPRRRPAA